MPRKKIGEDEVLEKKNKKVSSVEKTKFDVKNKGKKKVKENNLDNRKNIEKSDENKKSVIIKKELLKPEEKKKLPEIKSKKELPKPEEKKNLPEVKSKKELPKPEDKKKLPKVKSKKELPKSEAKKELPNPKSKKLFSKEKKVLDDSLTSEEKDLKILEKIKEFFGNNPEKTSKLDSEIEKNPEFLTEYYDLPYRYNETVVKILAQTPKRLFIYWDISDKDIEKYRKAFGEDFFEKTYPVLLIHNEELNYTYEVPINDFANSWYLDIKDSKCKYTVQLGRKFKEIPKIERVSEQIALKENINLRNDYIEIVNSNTLEAPNDRILFDEIKPTITYRNVKTHEEFTKDITNVFTGFAKVYNVYDLYKIIYKDEFDTDMFDLNNPSSAGNPSSSMTSRIFK